MRMRCQCHFTHQNFNNVRVKGLFAPSFSSVEGWFARGKQRATCGVQLLALVCVWKMRLYSTHTVKEREKNKGKERDWTVVCGLLGFFLCLHCDFWFRVFLTDTTETNKIKQNG